MGPYSHDEPAEPGDAALRERFPGWDVRRVFGGWLAVPARTPVIRGMYLESIAEKIAAHPTCGLGCELPYGHEGDHDDLDGGRWPQQGNTSPGGDGDVA